MTNQQDKGTTWILSILFMFLLPNFSHAQCTFKNTAFKSGEFLSYNLYYNWKFIWVKAGLPLYRVSTVDIEATPAFTQINFQL